MLLTTDILLCGKCRQLFTDVDRFVSHKSTPGGACSSTRVRRLWQPDGETGSVTCSSPDGLDLAMTASDMDTAQVEDECPSPRKRLPPGNIATELLIF